MDRKELFDRVVDVSSDVLGIDPSKINESTTFDDLDADSLDRLQLVTSFEDEFGIELAEDQLTSINSVSDALDAIEACQRA